LENQDIRAEWFSIPAMLWLFHLVCNRYHVTYTPDRESNGITSFVASGKSKQYFEPSS